jgi:ribosomal protein S27E
MNEQFKRDIARHVKNSDLGQKLPPGSPRRYEPTGGVGKHNARIHKESKISDSKNLDFSFRKPQKPIGRSVYIQCDNCGYITSATTATAGIICPECKKFSTVSAVNDE